MLWKVPLIRVAHVLVAEAKRNGAKVQRPLKLQEALDKLRATVAENARTQNTNKLG